LTLVRTVRKKSGHSMRVDGESWKEESSKMKIQFDDKKQAVRFAAAVVSVTGREPLLTRTETARWRVQSADLNSELAYAISSLLASGISSQRVTLDQVAERVESQGWAPLGPQLEGGAAARASTWTFGLGQLLASRATRREEAGVGA
jgi:hypothetical protein